MRKLLLFILCFIMLLAATPVTASADMGPKPSVTVKFEGLGTADCYVTLLSETTSTGPFSVYNSSLDAQPHLEHEGDYGIWQKFVSYKDADGFYFLQYFTKLDGNTTFKWSYYPPKAFKILVYFSDSDTFAVSNEVYAQYAFDSYYTADLSALDGQPAGGQTFGAVRSYDYGLETVSLIALIVITVGLELAVALLFGFRKKKQLVFIAAVNIITQTLLNVLLNLINYSQGQMMFVLNYIWLEILVIVIEAVLYAAALKRLDRGETEKRRPVLYALTANIASFAAGLIVAHLIPGIF